MGLMAGSASLKRASTSGESFGVPIPTSRLIATNAMKCTPFDRSIRYASRTRMVRWGVYAGTYAVFGAVALALTLPRGSPLLHPHPRLVLDASSAHAWSLCV